MSSEFSAVIFISGGGSFAAYAKQAPILSDIKITIVADRYEVRYPETVDIWLPKLSADAYWSEFQTIAERYNLVFINFNWIIPAEICRKLAGKMINQHLSLLPSFKGLNVQKNVLRSGVRMSGSTFHFVAPEVDSGPIIAQTFYPVSPEDTPETLGSKNWIASKDAYVQVIRWFADGRIKITTDQTVEIIEANYGFAGCIPNIEISI